MRSSKKPETVLLTGNLHRVSGSQHLTDLLDAYQSKPFQPGVYSVLVRHDSWCRLLNNRGACNCNPDIELTDLATVQHSGVRK